MGFMKNCLLQLIMNNSLPPGEKKYTPAPRVWLIGAFFQRGTKGRLQALYETCYTLTASAMPFWLGGIIFLALGKGDPEEPWYWRYFQLAVTTFDKGELLIFAVSFVSPALWLASHEPEGATVLPHKRPILLATGLIGIVSATLYALTQAQIPVQMGIIFWISIVLAVLSILIMYLALTYHTFRLPVVDLTEEDLRRPQNDFLSSFNSRRSQP